MRRIRQVDAKLGLIEVRAVALLCLIRALSTKNATRRKPVWRWKRTENQAGTISAGTNASIGPLCKALSAPGGRPPDEQLADEQLADEQHCAVPSAKAVCCFRPEL